MATRRERVFTNRSGQSLVEFALALPLMVLIVAGIFDLGRAFFAYITITNAAREGARYGALNRDNLPGVCQASKEEAQSSGIVLTDSDITIFCSNNYTCPGTTGTSCPKEQSITVNVSYDYEMILKFFFPGGIHMEREVEMLVP